MFRILLIYLVFFNEALSAQDAEPAPAPAVLETKETPEKAPEKAAEKAPEKAVEKAAEKIEEAKEAVKLPPEEQIVKDAKEEIQKKQAPTPEGKGLMSRIDAFRDKYYIPRVGAFVSGAIPHPINYGMEFVWDRHFGLAFSSGRFTYGDTFGDDEEDEFRVDLQLVHQEIKAFWIPWKKRFFMGLAYGTQKIFLEAEDELGFKVKEVDISVNTIGQIEVTTQYVTPHMGWIWWTDLGITFGFDFGAQIPVGNSSSLNLGFEDVTNAQVATLKTREEYLEVEEDVNDAGELVGNTILPYINLLKVGYIF